MSTHTHTIHTSRNVSYRTHLYCCWNKFNAFGLIRFDRILGAIRTVRSLCMFVAIQTTVRVVLSFCCGIRKLLLVGLFLILISFMVVVVVFCCWHRTLKLSLFYLFSLHSIMLVFFALFLHWKTQTTTVRPFIYLFVYVWVYISMYIILIWSDFDG